MTFNAKWPPTRSIQLFIPRRARKHIQSHLFRTAETEAALWLLLEHLGKNPIWTADVVFTTGDPAQRCAPCTAHRAPQTPHHTAHYPSHTAHRTLHTAPGVTHCALHTAYCTPHTAHRTPHTARRTPRTAQRAPDTVTGHRAGQLYSVHFDAGASLGLIVFDTTTGRGPIGTFGIRCLGMILQ